MNLASSTPIRNHNKTAGGHEATGIANNATHRLVPVARATEERCAGRNIGWHSIAHQVVNTVVASTRRATRTCYSHCRVNETRTEPLVMHLRAMRDKCLIKRIRRVVFFCSSEVKVRNTIRRQLNNNDTDNRPKNARRKCEKACFGGHELRERKMHKDWAQTTESQHQNTVQRTLCQVLHMPLHAPTRFSARSNDQRLQKRRHLNTLDRTTISSSSDRTNDLNVTNRPTQQRD